MLSLFEYCAIRAISAACRRIGYSTPRAGALGDSKVWRNRVANLATAPVTGNILTLAAVFIPGTNLLRTLTIMMSDSRNCGALV